MPKYQQTFAISRTVTVTVRKGSSSEEIADALKAEAIEQFNHLESLEPEEMCPPKEICTRHRWRELNPALPNSKRCTTCGLIKHE